MSVLLACFHTFTKQPTEDMYHFHGDIWSSTIHCSKYQEKEPEEEAYKWCLKQIDPPCFEILWINRNIGKLVEKD